MKSTKEMIIAVSIDEFASNGYDKASMRKIAEKVGIKASSIYNHFKSKEDILEEIFQYYSNIFYQDEINFIHDEFPLTMDMIPSMLKQGLALVVNTLKKPEMSSILKIVMKEQFKNPRIREFFLIEFIQKPRTFMKEFMKHIMKQGLIQEGCPHLYSQEFHAFAIYKMYEEFMLKDFNMIDIDELQQQINEHIDFFWSSIKK